MRDSNRRISPLTRCGRAGVSHVSQRVLSRGDSAVRALGVRRMEGIHSGELRRGDGDDAADVDELDDAPRPAQRGVDGVNAVSKVGQSGAVFGTAPDGLGSFNHCHFMPNPERVCVYVFAFPERGSQHVYVCIIILTKAR